MGGEAPTQGSSSPQGSKAGGVGTTEASDSDLPEKNTQKGGSGSSDGNRLLESGSSPEDVSNTQKGGGSSSGADTQTQGAGQSSSANSSVNPDYSAKRKAIVFDKAVQMLIEDVKNLNISMQKTEDDKK